MKKYCLLKSLRTTALVCALMLLPLAAFAQDAVQVNAARQADTADAETAAANDTYPSHYWARRALNTRYSIDRSGVAPAYHAGMLPFAESLTLYSELSVEYTDSPVAIQVGTEYEHDITPAFIGAVLPLGSRFGLGAEIKYNSAYNSTEQVLVELESRSASLSAGLRITRRFAVGATAGITSTELSVRGDLRGTIPSETVEDGFVSIDLLWSVPERDVWGGFRVTTENNDKRPYYYYIGLNDSGDGENDERYQLLIDPAPPRSEGFLRAGLMGGSLLLSFHGTVDWSGYPSYGDSGIGRIYPVIARDFVAEYAFTPLVLGRLGYHRSDFGYEFRKQILDPDAELDDSGTAADDAVEGRSRAHGVLVGATLNPGSFLLDLNVSYRQSLVMLFPWDGADGDLLRFGLHLVWER